MKKRISVIFVIMMSVLMLTACGTSSSIKLPMGLKFGDSYEKIYDAMSKVGKTVVIDHDGEYESLKTYVLHGDDTASISYLGCEWGVECMANEDGLFDVCLDAQDENLDYDKIKQSLIDEYGAPDNESEEDEYVDYAIRTEWFLGEEKIEVAFVPGNEFRHDSINIFYFLPDQLSRYNDY